ncbi:hypothetical protein PCE1_002553 [Barthelona sp. PCE]
MPRKINNGINFCLKLASKYNQVDDASVDDDGILHDSIREIFYSENEGQLDFGENHTVDIYLGQKTNIPSINSHKNIVSCMYSTTTAFNLGSVPKWCSSLKRCAWDHMLYYCEPERVLRNDKFLSVAFFTFYYGQFTFSGVDELYNVDDNKEFIFLDRNTFISYSGEDIQMVLMEEGFPIKKIYVKGKDFGTIGSCFYFTFRQEGFIIRTRDFQSDADITGDLAVFNFRYICNQSYLHSMTDCFTTCLYGMERDGYSELKVHYFDGEFVRSINLCLAFPQLTNMARMFNIEYLKLQLDGAEKVMVMSCTLNRRECIIVFEGDDRLHIEDYSTYGYFGPKYPFSRNFDYLPQITKRFIFSGGDLLKTSMLLNIDDLLLSIDTRSYDIKCVFEQSIVFTTGTQIINFDLGGQTVYSTDKWSFWSPGNNKMPNIHTSMNVGGYLVLVVHENNLFNYFCYDVRSYNPADSSNVMSGFLFRIGRRHILLDISTEYVRFCVHINNICRVYDYLIGSKCVKLLFEIDNCQISQCTGITEKKIQINSEYIYYFELRGDEWVNTMDERKFKPNSGCTTVVFGEKQCTVKDLFSYAITSNVILCETGVYLVENDGLSAELNCRKIVDLKGQGIEGLHMFTTLLMPNSFVAAKLDGKTLRHRTYIFNENGACNMEQNDIDLCNYFMNAVYSDFTDCFVGNDRQLLTENLCEINIHVDQL